MKQYSFNLKKRVWLEETSILITGLKAKLSKN